MKRRLRYAGLSLSLLFVRQLYLSGAWLGVDLRADTKKSCVYKRLVYRLKIC